MISTSRFDRAFEERTSSAAMVAVELVLMTGTTLNVSWGISVTEAKRKMAEGRDPRKS